ncbi:MAG: hypothetical protein ACLQNE_17950 [Thermoguttaceae bacterium]
MTLRLDLPPDLEQRLTAEAGRLGLAPDQCALRVLGQHLPLKEGSRDFLALVRSWMEEDDPDEQKETFEYLVHVLDEDRPSERKLFPPELKGISW